MGCCMARYKDNGKRRLYEDESAEDYSFKIIKDYGKRREELRIEGKPVYPEYTKTNTLAGLIKKKKSFEKPDDMLKMGGYKLNGSQSEKSDVSDDKVALLDPLRTRRKSLPRSDANINININVKYVSNKVVKKTKRERKNTRCKSKDKERKFHHSTEREITLNLSNILEDNFECESEHCNNHNAYSFNYINCSDDSFSLNDISLEKMIPEFTRQFHSNTSPRSSSNNHVSNTSTFMPVEDSKSENRKEYFSMSSNAIQGGVSLIRSCCSYDEYNYSSVFHHINDCSCLVQSSRCIFYFEISYLMIWAKEYLKSCFSELNFLVILEMDDDAETQEKIYFRQADMPKKYVPLFKKEDITLVSSGSVNAYNSYKCIKSVRNKIINDNAGISIHKISIRLCTYTSNKLLVISEEDMYIQITNENQMMKFNFYKNMNMKYLNKKIANILFDLLYTKDNPNTAQLDPLSLKNHFSKIGTLSTFQETPNSEFLFYNIPNSSIRHIIKKDDKDKGFHSIHDIDDVDIIGELHRGEIDMERLIELLSKVTRKYEIFEILKKINDDINKLDEDKILTVKEHVIEFLNEIKESNNTTAKDKVLIPFCFLVIKNLFCTSNQHELKRNRCRSFASLGSFMKGKGDAISMNNVGLCCNDKDKDKDKDGTSPAIEEKENSEFIINQNLFASEENNLVDTSLLLTLNSIELGFKFINMESEVDILLSALNYINKQMEKRNILELEFPKGVAIDAKFERFMKYQDIHIKNVEDFILYYITKNNLIEDFHKILLAHITNPSCVMPITKIFSQMLKSHFIQGLPSENYDYIVQVFSKILSVESYKQLSQIYELHSSNSFIMTNFLQIISNFISINHSLSEPKDLLHIVDIPKIKDICLAFKLNNFDLIHETCINLIKAMLINNSKKNSMTDDDFTDVVSIFSSVLVLLKNRIHEMEIKKLSKWSFNLLTILYTIANIINNINFKQFTGAFSIYLQSKFPNKLVELFYEFHEKKFFGSLDEFLKLDSNVLNVKMMLFRTLFHCITLIRNIGVHDKHCLSRQNAEKMYKTIKDLEDNDKAYNPKNLQKVIEKNFKNKTDLMYKSLSGINQTNFDYYCRYKTILVEFITEIITIIRSHEFS